MLTTGKILMIAGWRYYFCSSLRFLILNDSILMDLLMGFRNFIFKLFTKERKKSLEFSQNFCYVINGMIFMFDHCWKSRKSFLTFVICMIFFPHSFHVILALDQVIGEVISFGILKSFFNYISIPFKYLMKNFVD